MEINNQLFPKQLWERLLAMVVPQSQSDDLYPDIGIFIKKYAENQTSQECRDAKNAFEKALSVWQGDLIKEFLCNWVFEPPLSLEVEMYSPEERRRIFQEIYTHIFDQ